MNQTEKGAKIGITQQQYSNQLIRLKTKSFLTDNDKKVLSSEKIDWRKWNTESEK